MKPTAIEELIKKWSSMGTQKIDSSIFLNDLNQLQAKHKEEKKEDIIKAFVDGVEDERSWYIHNLPERAEQYHKENHEPK